MQRWTKPFWIVLASIFLFESWVWDFCAAFGRRLLKLIPWDSFKADLKKFFDGLPAPVVLVVFLVPVGVLEPIKIFALWLIASGHWTLGILGFLVAKFVGFGIIAILFDLTREKLLSMKWMATLYAFVIHWVDWAHNLVDPYQQALRAQIVDLKLRVARFVRENSSRNSYFARIIRIRNQARNNRPPS